MLNTFATLLLVSTSLAPILGAVAVNEFARHEPWAASGWVLAALVLIFLCWFMLRYAAKNAQVQPFHIKEFERSDQEVLAFLLAYLLPFISNDNLTFTGSWLTGGYILLVIFLVVAHAGALHFNPVMGLFGFHFYAVKNGDGVSHVLISKIELRRPSRDIEAVRLTNHVYLQVGGSDA